MRLNKRCIGELVQLVDERNTEGINDFRGLDINKEFISTKANTVGLDKSKYKVVRSNRFVFSGMQTGRDRCIRIGMSREPDPFIVSPAYATFDVTNDRILPTYLFMQFLSPEMDRRGWFCSDGSVRANLDWDVFCDIEVALPPTEIQLKYAAIYESMLANQRSYEQGLNDLKTSCDALVEKLIREVPSGPIGPYIEQSNDRNSRGLGKDAVRGLSIDKQLIQTKAKLDGVSLSGYKVVEPDYLAYVPVTSRNGGKISVALNDTDETLITSSINTVFRVREEARSQLLPAYLMLFFGRTEFDRYARFCSWGSARETFGWDEMCDVRIPLSDVSTQRCVVGLYQAWRTRSEINKRLKSQLKEIAPVLIRGSIEEASR